MPVVRNVEALQKDVTWMNAHQLEGGAAPAVDRKPVDNEYRLVRDAQGREEVL